MLKRIFPVLVVVLGACAKDAAPPNPTQMVAVTPTTLAPTVVGQVVMADAAFEFRTAGGKVVKNVLVGVTVTAGGGSLMGAPTRSVADGPTSIGTWTLGTGTGVHTVTVTGAGFAPIVFSVTALADVPVLVAIVEGDDQRAPENAQIPLPMRVLVTDQHDNGVPNVTVTWAVDAGGGNLPGTTTSLTDTDGIATAPAWILGDAGSGEQALTATVAGLTAARFVAEIQAPAASLQIEADAPSTAAVGSVLSPTFTVRDAEGNVLNGVPVTVTVTDGGGSIGNAPAVSAAGPTPVGNWTLGTSPSAQELTVEVSGVPSLVFATDAETGPAAIIVPLEGDDQEAAPGQTIANQIRVLVTDAYDNLITNTQVNWSVARGGGLVGAATSLTDGVGETTAPSWSVGNCGGPQTLRATVGSATGDVEATMTETTYGLEVHWSSTQPGGAIQAAFDAACVRINQVIVDSIEAVNFVNFDAGPCVAGLTLNEIVRGLRIYASVTDIDGVGGILGSAGPCYARPIGSTNQYLSIVGRMQFDAADLENLVANGSIQRVILHEMLHVIGVGTLWNFAGLMTGSAPTTPPFFTGPLAKASCITDHGGATPCATAVPIEDCLGTGIPASCGPGTINAHWKESIFRTELMTGYLSPGAPFSKMTIQSLADLGYPVDSSVADAYTVPAPSLMSLQEGLSIQMPEPTGLIGIVDRNGRLIHRFELRR